MKTNSCEYDWNDKILRPNGKRLGKHLDKCLWTKHVSDTANTQNTCLEVKHVMT